MNLFYEDYPTAVCVGGKDIPIITDFREIIKLTDMLRTKDLAYEEKMYLLQQYFQEPPEDFEKAVKDLFLNGEININSDIMITNLRHKEVLKESLDSLVQVSKSILNNMPEDFYSIDLMSAYKSLGKIIGEEVEEDLVNEIFSKFCMGK